MNIAWKRLLEVARDPETGASTVEKPTVTAGTDDDDDDAPTNAPDDAAKAWERYAKKLRAEQANKRQTIKELTAREATAIARIASETAAVREAAKSEREAEIAKVHKQYAERFIQADVKSALVAAGVVDANAGLKLIDASGITVDEAGLVKGVAEAVAKLKVESTFLFKTTISTSSTTETPKPSAAEVKSVKEMTDAEYKAHKTSMGLR